MDERLNQYEEKMQKSIEALENEFSGIRAGRANPHLLDKIKVDYYGTPTPLQQVGNISVPEARMLQIQPWESSLIKDIEKAILNSDIGINPVNDGRTIRLVFPELTEERRKELAKDIKKKGEGAKVAIRNIRRDANDAFKKMNKAGEVSDDEVKSLESEIQKLTDKYVANNDSIGCFCGLEQGDGFQPAFLSLKNLEENNEYSESCGNYIRWKWKMGKKKADAKTIWPCQRRTGSRANL